MNRGLAHRPIFEECEDTRFFLSRLALAVRRGEIEVHAWCLMTTHFHLLVYSPRGELDVALRRIQHEHTRRFNRRRGRDGPLYRSRFTSRPIDSYAYRDMVIRYIDANPVEAGMVTDAALHLDGSASWYARRRGPVWMSRGVIEGDVRRRAGKTEYDPLDYAAAFGSPLSPNAKRLIEARMNRPVARGDPTDSLLASAPEHVRTWLVECAQLGDGLTPGLALADPAGTLEDVRARRERAGYWTIHPGRKSESAWDLMEVGLVRALCRSNYVEIQQLTGLPRSTVWSRCKRHALAIEHDAEYGLEAARIASEILQRTYGGGAEGRTVPSTVVL